MSESRLRLPPLDIRVREDGFVLRGPPGTRRVLLDATEHALLERLRQGATLAEVVRRQPPSQSGGSVFNHLRSLLNKLDAAGLTGSAVRVRCVLRSPLRLPGSTLLPLLLLAAATVLWGGVSAFRTESQVFAGVESPLRPLLLGYCLLVLGTALSALVTSALLAGAGFGAQLLHFSARGGLLRLEEQPRGDELALPRRQRLPLYMLRVLLVAVPAAAAMALMRDAAFIGLCGWLLQASPTWNNGLRDLLEDWLRLKDIGRHARSYRDKLLVGLFAPGFHEEMAILTFTCVTLLWMFAVLHAAGALIDRWPVPRTVSLLAFVPTFALWLVAIGIILYSGYELLHVTARSVRPVFPTAQARFLPVGNPDEIREVLRRAPVLAGLTEEELDSLMPLGQLIEHAPRQLAARCEDMFHVIVLGEASVVERHRSGLTREVARLRQGDAFGRLRSDKTPAAVRAEKRLRTLSFELAAWEQWMHDHQQSATKLQSVARIAVLLHANPLFAGLEGSTIFGLAGLFAPVTFQNGQTVIREGDSGDNIFLVEEGQLQVRVGDSVTQTLKRGDVFGEVALLRGVPRTATVIAISACQLYALSAENFWRILAQDLDLGTTMELLASQRHAE